MDLYEYLFKCLIFAHYKGCIVLLCEKLKKTKKDNI